MSLTNYQPQHGRYFPLTETDLPDAGIFNVEEMAPEMRARSLQPGNLITTNAGAATRLFTWNPLRRWAWVINNHLTENAFIVFGAVDVATSASGGILVANGGTLIFGLNTDLPYTGPVSCFTVNAGTLSIGEG